MRKLLTVFLIAGAIVCGGISADAQNRKSGKAKAKSSASSPMTMKEDGYPNIIGHTYRYGAQGMKLDFTFYKDYALIKASANGDSESAKCPYTYEDDYVAIYDPNVDHTPMFDGQVNYDGKYIILSSGYTMKLVK